MFPILFGKTNRLDILPLIIKFHHLLKRIEKDVSEKFNHIFGLYFQAFQNIKVITITYFSTGGHNLGT